MSQLKLTADSGGGTVAIKGPASTTGNAAIELTVPGTGSGTLAVGDTGKILQVVQATKTDVFSTSTTGSYVDITGLTVNITPTKANSNILVMAVIGSFTSGDATAIALTTADGTAIIQGDAVSGKDSVSTGSYAGGTSTGEAWYGNNPAPIFKLHDPSYSSVSYTHLTLPTTSKV